MPKPTALEIEAAIKSNPEIKRIFRILIKRSRRNKQTLSRIKTKPHHSHRSHEQTN